LFGGEEDAREHPLVDLEAALRRSFDQSQTLLSASQAFTRTATVADVRDQVSELAQASWDHLGAPPSGIIAALETATSGCRPAARPSSPTSNAVRAADGR
jgi:hypothetical protein